MRPHKPDRSFKNRDGEATAWAMLRRPSLIEMGITNERFGMTMNYDENLLAER